MSTTRAHRTKLIETDPKGRPSVPEPTFLQILGGSDAASRMVELPMGPVRVGRGAHCEVRLVDDRLGDVQCMLRRRGTTWHYQPVGPPGQVWFNAEAADRQRPIPLGVPFRVGSYWLTLRPLDSATNDWGTYDAPITVEPATESVTPAPAAPGPVQDPTPDPERVRPNPPGDDEERLRRWEARLDQRERWLKDRQEERRWEARWKSAGETIRTRSTPPSGSPPPIPPRPSPTIADPRTSSRPSQTPPLARIIEPKAPEPIRRVTGATPRPPSPRVVVGPRIDPPSLARIEVKSPSSVLATPAPLDSPEVPQALPSRALVQLEALPTVPDGLGNPEGDPSGPSTTAPLDRIEIADSPAIESFADDPSLVIEGDPLGESTIVVDPPSVRVTDLAIPLATPAIAIQVETVPTFETADPKKAPAEIASEAVPREPDAEVEVYTGQARSTVDFPRDATSSKTQWPSARSIFEAQGRRVGPVTSVEGSSRQRPTEPEPTESLGPACWRVSLWLGVPPVLFVTLSLGLVGVLLAYEWAVEASNANLAIRMATRPDKTPGPSIDVELIPQGGWWSSTGSHLSAWAMALARAGDGEDHTEQVRALLDAARTASPLGWRTRFAIEWPAHLDPGSVTGLANLGRTRDVVSLVWLGRHLRKQGKFDPALRAYQSAMILAMRSRQEDLDAPTFYEDPQLRRYALPHEGLIGLVAKAMAEDGDWTPEQWSAALPPSSTATWTAARILSKRLQVAQADRLADQAIRLGDSPGSESFDPAEERAAAAEALAYRGRWTDAAEQYRLAIDQAADDTTRRMWWLNLAEVAQRANDDAGRARAIEAARSPTLVDEVTRRALRYQQSLSGPTQSSPRR